MDMEEQRNIIPIRRTVPNIKSGKPEASREFYVDFLGMEVAMERKEIISFVSPNNRTAQISVMSHNASGVPFPDVSVEVADVDEVHAKAGEQDIDIIYPLTDEPWGVRRFFVLDPNGTVINILSHL